MLTPVELRQIAVRHGGDKKRDNAIVALLCGAVSALLVNFRFASAASWQFWVGLIVGLIWGNAFEYAYHRWLLHRPHSPLGTGHHQHHAQTGTIEEAEHVALISSPLNVILLFIINGVPAFLLASVLGLWSALPGVFIGWSVYVIVTEEIHWRIHMNGWLPAGLRFARAYHLSHHGIPISRYNVFLPLFDFLLGSTGSGRSKVPI